MLTDSLRGLAYGLAAEDVATLVRNQVLSPFPELEDVDDDEDT
ncbi:hypothetical protein GCM10023321_02370 [Pseudonocardia eucalypti]|uniref:Uncharacterized protein n=1 Tax=Pseudonocardia eucalypti TaxID=648755 RepID=A0ABP9PFZ6_9PSEU|nr:hypothetical protein [Pseudonocardia eucalypti]